MEATRRIHFSQHQGGKKRYPEERVSSHIWLLLILHITQRMSPPQRGLTIPSESVVSYFHHSRCSCVLILPMICPLFVNLFVFSNVGSESRDLSALVTSKFIALNVVPGT